MTHSERRRSPRVKSGIPVKISMDENDFITQTADLGASGALFRTEQAIPLMSRLAVTLLVPSLGKKQSTRKIICQGVVVRCLPADSKLTSEKYNIAIYFTSLKEADKKTLLRFVQKTAQKPGMIR
ncbi:MAG: PilZ domain-containing protein [Candidatus Omnitrophica bacterium]|nr:PilZ domain-containing protein [Candidatus Omnitrophota bacterium]